MKIASIDFETANYSHISICAASIATFENGELIESLYWLVRPPKGHGYFREAFTEDVTASPGSMSKTSKSSPQLPRSSSPASPPPMWSSPTTLDSISETASHGRAFRPVMSSLQLPLHL